MKVGVLMLAGPRLVDGLELLAHILHPEAVPTAPSGPLTVDL